MPRRNEQLEEKFVQGGVCVRVYECAYACICMLMQTLIYLPDFNKHALGLE